MNSPQTTQPRQPLDPLRISVSRRINSSPFPQSRFPCSFASCSWTQRLPLARHSHVLTRRALAHIECTVRRQKGKPARSHLTTFSHESGTVSRAPHAHWKCVFSGDVLWTRKLSHEGRAPTVSRRRAASSPQWRAHQQSAARHDRRATVARLQARGQPLPQHSSVLFPFIRFPYSCQSP